MSGHPFGDVVFPAAQACPVCGRPPGEDEPFMADEERGTAVCRHACPLAAAGDPPTGCGAEWSYWPEGLPSVGEWVGP